ncbi:MAG: recombinase family protein [Defluviitaleaceae bacterium]|nr:recombinase family protein [Defluviitaleaceae bacterium]
MKAALYVRLSEEDRDKKSPENDSISIQNQKSMLLSYALEQGWYIYDFYSDDDFKGADRNRPEWQRLLADAEQKKFDAIVCKTQSRFTRELEMVEKYIHGLFPVWGIRFIGVVDNADTDNKGNKKSRQINGLVNEWYLEDMSESIKSALTTRREQGFHIGSVPLYGYIKDPDNKGKLLIDEEAAEIVREVFNLYASGYGKTYIARLLNDRGVPNPTEYKRLKGINYKVPSHKLGTHWKYFAIANMLINEIYIGTMVQGKYGSVSYKTGVNKPRPKSKWMRAENTHEPIINRELWDRVQELVKLNAKPFGNGKTGIFAKKAKCTYCDYTMRTAKSHGYYYLKCDTRHTSTNACPGGFISVKELEQTVLNELQRLLDENLNHDEVALGVRLVDNIAVRLTKLELNKSTYVKKIAEYSKAVKDSYMDKVKGIISESEFVKFSRDFTADKERIETLVKEIDEEIVALEHKSNATNDRRKIVEQYATINQLERVMVEKLICHIKIGKRDRESKKVPVEIHWNF